MALKTDYKDYIPADGAGALRKYKQTDNGDGTYSFQDMTDYQQTGDKMQASIVNTTNAEVNRKAYLSAAKTATLTASGWTGSDAPYSQTISVDGVTATSANEILPGASISASQLELLQLANLQDGGQAAGSITVLAYGGKPTSDLPIRVIVRGDL